VNPLAVLAWLRRLSFASRDGPTQHMLLLQLATMADHGGWIQLGKRPLGAQLERDPSTIKRQLHKLAALGIIEIHERKTRKGQQLANVFRVLTDWVQRMVAGEQREPPRTAPALELEPGNFIADGEAPWRPPPRIYANGGCLHSVPACEACRA